MKSQDNICNIKDLRRNDYYLTESQKKEWDKRNILYNNIWFYLRKKNEKGMPDVEYSDVAIEAYKKIEFFSKWNVIYHSNVGKVLVSDKGVVLNADLMTGWWNPAKYYLELGARSTMAEEFLKKIPSDNCEEKVIDWIVTEKGKTKESAKAFLEFLKVVYTEGNIIPAPKNWIGRGLDSWPNKLEEIVAGKLDVAKEWNQYIDSFYGGKLKDFLRQNMLEMYMEDENVISFWGEDKPHMWTRATEEQWKNYFVNARKIIVTRNNRINGLV